MVASVFFVKFFRYHKKFILRKYSKLQHYKKIVKKSIDKNREIIYIKFYKPRMHNVILL